jgi:hypothetical protein
MGILARRFTNISPPTRCGRTSANLYAFDLQAVVGMDLRAVVIDAIRDSLRACQRRGQPSPVCRRLPVGSEPLLVCPS